jgi:hypothetical protein
VFCFANVVVIAPSTYKKDMRDRCFSIYNRLQIVKSNYYLKKMQQIFLDKEVNEYIKEHKRKEREEKKAKKVVESLNLT